MSSRFPHAVAVTALLLPQCAPQTGTVGAMLAQRADGSLVIRETPSGLAAARAGIEPGDEVLLINGRDVRPMSSKELHQTLSGAVGEPVKLTLIRGESVIRVTLQRSPAPARRGAPGSGAPEAAK
jgi:C-terminal processing protease CtpA/Prc